MAQVLCSWMKTLGDVVESQSANCFTFERPPGGYRETAMTRRVSSAASECRSTDQRGARHAVAVLVGRRQLRLVGRRIDRTLGDDAGPRPEVRPVAQRIQLDAEHRALSERGCRDPLLRHC